MATIRGTLRNFDGDFRFESIDQIGPSPKRYGYMTPHAKHAGKEKEIFAQRNEKLEAGRKRRRLRRAEAIHNVV